jgi:hypothetical protein
MLQRREKIGRLRMQHQHRRAAQQALAGATYQPRSANS